jgi:surface carbohydrate biosynthesis protein
MDYLNTVSDENWKQTRQQYASELMEFDPDNTRFVALLDQLLPRTDSQSNPIKSHAN